ncbi:23S rRNA (uracil(1939)-C(5))-methyltransferase RlmD [Desulfonema magnum]|uniref:Methyltransferase domain-containing protein n=1 Tax=Desulfonema magnum TaxID=45655 RepID=A0A975GRZ8_9BACT|nr:23S rRNA (uracil(1939)-C(5))-methyltransferase RlmD [Desulfonema magnum]QTA90553.1 Methyltransferase domain-containing protein [Desulfonema magnum]
MAIKKGDIIELKISDIAFGGKGLTRVNGLAVFVDQSVPSDYVKVRIIKKKKNYAEARILEIIEPSPLRTDPPCKYSNYCGGCKWQFLDYDKQVEYKQQHVSESIEHIGVIENVPVHPTIPSELIFGYRNKMEFSCSDKRWLLPDEMGREDIDTDFALGLHVPGTFHKVLDTDACLLHPDLGNHILEDIRKFIKHSRVPVYGLRSHVGFWRFVMLRHSVAYDQWMVNIITASEDRDTVQPLADLLMEKYPGVVSVINNITSRKAGIAIGEYEILLAGESVLKDKIGPFEFEISANSFFQTNTRGAERLYETVKNYAGLTSGETVVDLYSGTGTIALYLSGLAKKVIGMEIIESAVADAENNCRVNSVSNCQFIRGDIKNCLSQLTITPEVMIIDPPRVGMHKNVVKQVMEMAPERIVYVSCNPSTLARDMGMMKEDYDILEVQPVDMFPHTYHIESVAKLQKK